MEGRATLFHRLDFSTQLAFVAGCTIFWNYVFVGHSVNFRGRCSKAFLGSLLISGLNCFQYSFNGSPYPRAQRCIMQTSFYVLARSFFCRLDIGHVLTYDIVLKEFV